MKILILGGNGMIGSNLSNYLQDSHQVGLTYRGDAIEQSILEADQKDNCFFKVNVLDNQHIQKVIQKYMPEMLINAVGITKQLIDSHEEKLIYDVNAVFPHELSKICSDQSVKLIHLSTDCIFSGKTGFYSEADSPDAEDIYGKSKYLGEVDKNNAITIRKSTIGLELKNSHGLIEWFLQSKGQIKGFRRAIYTGITTQELATVVNLITENHMDLTGVWNVSSQPISKYDLLSKLNALLDRKDIEIVPDDDFVCDRSLDGTAFENRTGYLAPSWDRMLEDLAEAIIKRNASLNRR